VYVRVKPRVQQPAVATRKTVRSEKKPGPPLKPARRTRLRAEGPRLTREDWLLAAHEAVVEGGFDNLRVLKIAKALRVTRGSFYWHFTSHADLRAELLAQWRQRQVAIDRELQPPRAADAQADLQHVLDVALAQVGPRLEHMRFELALRGLGRRDPAVAKLLAEVDALRLSLFEHKFARLTGDAQAATELAALFYLAVVGSYQALARPGNPPQLKTWLTRLITRYLIAAQAPNRGAASTPARRKR
jgi:AcrR family transcriptional regulator